MNTLVKTLAAVAAGTVLATNALAQSTKEVREVSPYVGIENEAPPKLIVDPTPLAAGLAHDIVWIEYHAENVRIVPVFGTGALNVSPRIGHLHVHMDDLLWGWVEATSDDNTISVAVFRPVSTRCLSSWSTLTTTYSLGAPSAGKRSRSRSRREHLTNTELRSLPAGFGPKRTRRPMIVAAAFGG